MFFRILASILFFISVLTLPWWASLLIGVVFLFKYENFFEIVVGGLLIDLLYGTPISYFGGFMYVSSVIALCVFVVRRFIAKNLFAHGLSA